MNQITAPPNVYDAGLDFDYSVWNANTEITLVNVPWNSDYRDIVKFENQAKLDAYIDSRETTQTRIMTNYARVGAPIKIEIPFAAAYKFNYVRVRNPAQPIAGDVPKTYYYFILDIQHLSPGTTQLQVQLDVWQTFGRNVTFGKSYIERGHIGIANENNFDNYGRDFLTVQEGLDTGAEYRVIAKKREDVANLEINSSNPSAPVIDNWYDVLVVSATDLITDPGTVEDPVMKSASGAGFQSIISGASFYIFSGKTSSFRLYLEAMSNYPWVTSGIISITMVPRITRYIPDFTYGPDGIPKKLAPTISVFPKQYNLWPNWRLSDEIRNAIPEKYRHLRKFQTYPYMVIELTTWFGSPIILKPESWANTSAAILERISYTPPNQRMSFHPRGYNAPAGAPKDDLYPDLAPYSWYPGGDGDDQGDYLDLATYISSFPNSPIVNDGAINFMASNTHGLAFQNDSANWSQSRALRGNQTSYDQASRGMQLTEELARNTQHAGNAQTALGNRTLESQMMLGAVGNVVKGAGMGALGGPAGAAIGGVGGLASGVMSAMSTGIQTGANLDSQNIRNEALNEATRSQIGAGTYMQNSNKQLADWAANGDYENTIAGIQARVQDSRLIQPSTSGQFGGDAMNFNNNTIELSARWKMIDPAHVRSIGDYWLRYGYAVSQFADIPASLMVMTKFTYWKLSETYFYSAVVPEAFKQAIRGIFEKGVTVWANANDIGMLDWADNEPLEGITL